MKNKAIASGPSRTAAAWEAVVRAVAAAIEVIKEMVRATITVAAAPIAVGAGILLFVAVCIDPSVALVWRVIVMSGLLIGLAAYFLSAGRGYE